MFREIKELLSENGRLIAAGFLLVFFSAFGQSIFFGVYLPSIQEDLNLTKTAIGTLYCLATVSSSILIIFTGKLLDIFPLRNIVAFVLLGVALGCFTMSNAYNSVLLFISFLLLRQFGQGLMVLSAATSINRYLKKHRGKGTAIINLGGPAFMMVFPLIALSMENIIEWRQAWLFYAAFVCFILLPGFWLYLRSHQRTTHANWEARRKEDEQQNWTLSEIEWTRKKVIMDWRFYALVSITFIAPFLGTVIVFYQHDVAASLGITPIAFASSFPFFTISSVLCGLFSGYIIDKYGERQAIIAFCIFYTIGLALLTNGFALLYVYIGMIFIGGANGVISTVGGPLLVQLYGTKHLGSIKSLLFSSSILSSALSSFVMGYLQDQGVDILVQFSWFIYYTGIVWVVAFPLCAKKAN